MWRSNVLGLRTCSSAVRSDALTRRWLSRSAPGAGAISEEEFLKALGKVLPRSKWHTQANIGLAVSGGVDSMALATMYARAAAVPTNSRLPKCHGLIIDHKVRPESTEEAEWVAQQLHQKFGIDATIIPLVWPKDMDPKDISRFETTARTLRYQALGEACRSHNIRSLMVGHHGNDQAETIMMRLMYQRFRTGLAAMRPVEHIPECYGLHGIYNSGFLRSQDVLKTGGQYPYPVEKGGVQLLRPLLDFEKSRLIATCENNGTLWAEDKTNQDISLTARNTIRHVLHNYKLPVALQTQSLIKTAERMQERIEKHHKQASKLFDSSLIKLDIQTGSLMIRFPPISALTKDSTSRSDLVNARNTAFFFLQRVAELISPQSKTSIAQLSNAVANVYPNFVDIDTEKALASTPPSQDKSSNANFCVAGIWWRKWTKPTLFSDPDEEPSNHAMEWLLCRQPLTRDEIASLETHITIPPTPSEAAAKWHLFDGRFWIKIHNRSASDLILRTFDEVAAQALIDNGKPPATQSDYNPSTSPDRFIRAALDLVQPAILRRHIPALFIRKRVPSPDPELDSDPAVTAASASASSSATEQYKDSLLALPTLGASINEPGPPSQICTWEIRYKSCNLGAHRARDVIMAGIRKRHIVDRAQGPSNEGVRSGIKRSGVRGKAAVRERRGGEEGKRRVESGRKAVQLADVRWRERQMRRKAQEARKERQNRDESKVEGLHGLRDQEGEGAGRTIPLVEKPVKRKRKIGWSDFEDRI